jgi:hypothetical protein
MLVEGLDDRRQTWGQQEFCAAPLANRDIIRNESENVKQQLIHNKYVFGCDVADFLGINEGELGASECANP